MAEALKGSIKVMQRLFELKSCIGVFFLLLCVLGCEIIISVGEDATLYSRVCVCAILF